jgi:cytochrome c oxidase subunit III
VSVAILFFGSVALIAAWWLTQQRIATKPWLEEGPNADLRSLDVSQIPKAKIGLAVFLAVVGSLFALFTLAYSMRMHMGDWRPLPMPTLLWINTGVLVLSSVALHRAQVAAGRREAKRMKLGLLAGGGLTLAFLGGQLLAWRQMIEAGYFAASNPANAFFYLLTAVHGLHLLGGMVALGRTTVKTRAGGREPESTRLSVELCAMYWHFLLLVWLVLFGLLLHHA